MGNSPAGGVRWCIEHDDLEGFQRRVQRRSSPRYLNRPLNHAGDTPLILAARHGRLDMVRLLVDAGSDVMVENRHHSTALDVALQMLQAGRTGSSQWHESACLNEQHQDNVLVLDDLAKLILSVQARGESVEKIILRHMQNGKSVENIIKCLKNMDSPWMFRTTSLLLQVCVWYQHTDNLISLFKNKAPLENFWTVPFMPRVVPSPHYKEIDWPEQEECGYKVLPLPESCLIQNLKFACAQDWRADWNDGQNPSAQFRAGLHMTPEGGVMFVRAATQHQVLTRVVIDMMQYLPALCDGPDLKQSLLIPSLIQAGYQFSCNQKRHLELKFNIDFSDYTYLHSKPKRLKQLCRTVLRAQFQHNVYWAVSRLPKLPTLLSRYLLLEDLY